MARGGAQQRAHSSRRRHTEAVRSRRCSQLDLPPFAPRRAGMRMRGLVAGYGPWPRLEPWSAGHGCRLHRRAPARGGGETDEAWTDAQLQTRVCQGHKHRSGCSQRGGRVACVALGPRLDLAPIVRLAVAPVSLWHPSHRARRQRAPLRPAYQVVSLRPFVCPAPAWLAQPAAGRPCSTAKPRGGAREEARHWHPGPCPPTGLWVLVPGRAPQAATPTQTPPPPTGQAASGSHRTGQPSSAINFRRSARPFRLFFLLFFFILTLFQCAELKISAH